MNGGKPVNLSSHPPDASARQQVGNAIPGVKPLPLPAELQPYWDTLADLCKNPGGYCWAKCAFFVRRWQVKRWKVYAILAKLRAFGRLLAFDVPGSHERRYVTLSLPPAPKARIKRNANHPQTVSCVSLRESESANAEKTTNPATVAEPNERTAEPSPEAAAVVVSPFERKAAETTKAAEPLKADEQSAGEAAVVVSLEKRNVSRTVAERVARLYPRERVKAAALAVDAYLKSRAGDVNRLIQTAARDGWTPNVDTDAALGQTATQERARKIQYVRAPAGFGTGNGGGVKT